MIIPDVNLLVYAYNRDAPHHVPAGAWWKNLMEGAQPVGLTWVVCLGYLRLMTNRKILARPLEASEALSHIHSWIARPQASSAAVRDEIGSDEWSLPTNTSPGYRLS